MINLANIRRTIYNICKRLEILEQGQGNSQENSSIQQVQSDWDQNDSQQVDFIKNKPNLFSGNYNDLNNKPTIPSEVTEQTVSGWGFTKNTGTSNFSGSYNDLTDKPTIPSVPSNEQAAQNGNTVSLVTTGEKYNWNNKANIWRGTQDEYDALDPDYDNNTIYIITPAPL